MKSRSPCIPRYPTLTRVWCAKGRRGQRVVQTPGRTAKCYGFGAVDWRDGTLDWAVAEGRRAAPLCDQLRRLASRSRERDRVALVILDNLSIHTPKGSRLLRQVLADLGEHLVLVYTPAYDPDANRIEWLWRALRQTVTHNHQRLTLAEVVSDAERWVQDLTADQVLAHIGSPFAPADTPEEDLAHAA